MAKLADTTTDLAEFDSLLSQDNQHQICSFLKSGANSSLIAARTNAELELAKHFIVQKCQAKGEPVLITTPDETGKIKIDATRAIIEKSITTTNKKRWFLIMQAETMTSGAQNSLLKLLEEPNSGMFLVLLSSTPNRLLTTVRSRTQTIKLRPIAKLALITFLKTNYPHLDATKQQQLLFLAQDNLQLLLELIHNDELASHHIQIATDARQLLTAKPAEALLIVKNYFNSRDEAITLAQLVLKIHHTIAITKATTNHFARATKWLTALTRLQQNCAVRLCLLEAVM